jgi:CcmD family protein
MKSPMTRATMKKTLTALAALVTAIVSLCAPQLCAVALAADEYEPLNEAARQRMDPSPYLLAAYGFIWAAVLVYVVMLARGMARTQADLDALRRRVDPTAR